MRVIIMRGLPGGGKSFKANQINEYLIKEGYTVAYCSNDDYPGYYENAEHSYQWSEEKVKKAIKYCEAEFDAAIAAKKDIIIVDNTHITHKSYSYYKEGAERAGYEVSFNVIKPRQEDLTLYAKRNKHKVHMGILTRMFRSWQD